jgi:hypothetical protein
MTTYLRAPHANVRVSGKPAGQPGLVRHEHVRQPPAHQRSPGVEEPDRLSPDHNANAVLELLNTLGWAVVATPDANVHATSPDGRIYVGWLPEDPAAWQRHIVWRVQVGPDHGNSWTQEFNPDTPSGAVAGFIAALVRLR